jgi:hypothetical protein
MDRKGRIEKDKWKKSIEAEVRKKNGGAKWRGGRMEEVEWMGRMKEQNGEKAEWRKNIGRSRMEGKNGGAKWREDRLEEE